MRVVDLTKDEGIKQWCDVEAKGVPGHQLCYTLGTNMRFNLRSPTDHDAALQYLRELTTWEGLTVFRPPIIINRNPDHSPCGNRFVLDLDPYDTCPAVKTELALRDLAQTTAQLIKEKLRELVHNPGGHNFHCIVLGDAPKDKGYRPSYHLFFPNLTANAVPDTVYKELQLVCTTHKVDDVIQFSGLSYGPSSKWLAKERKYRGTVKRCVAQVAMYDGAPDDDQAYYWCHGKDVTRNPGEVIQWAVTDPVAPSAALQQRGSAAVVTVKFDAGPSTEVRGAEDSLLTEAELPVLRAVIAWYKGFWDKGAEMQKKEVRVYQRERGGRMLRIYFVDSKNHRCKHNSNNHWVSVDMDNSTVGMHCGGADKSRKLAYPLEEIMNYKPIKFTGSSSELRPEDMPFLRWADGKYASDLDVGTACTEFDRAQHMLAHEERYFTGRGGRVQALMFAAPFVKAVYDETGKLDLVLKLFNLMITYSGEQHVYLYRDGRGYVQTASAQQLREMLRSYHIPKGKKPRPLYAEWTEWAHRATCSSMTWRRLVWDKKEHEGALALMVPMAYPPQVGHVFAPVQLEAARKLLDCIVSNLVWDGRPSMPDMTMDDFVHEQKQWVLDWLAETLMTSRPCGVILHFCDNHGGTGKSMFIELISLLLGNKQYLFMMNTADLHKNFNAHLPRIRLVCLDDAHNNDPNDLKNAATRKTVTYDVKYGSNGVNARVMTNHVVATNSMLKTNSGSGDNAMQRRIITCHPAHNMHSILNSADITNAGRPFRDHLGAMKYAFSCFEDEQLLSCISTMLAARWHARELETGDLRGSLRDRIERGTVISMQYRRSAFDEHGEVGDWLRRRLAEERELLCLHTLPASVSEVFTKRRDQLGTLGPLLVDALPTPDNSLGNVRALEYVDPVALRLAYTADTNTNVSARMFNASVVNALNTLGNGGAHSSRRITAQLTTGTRCIQYLPGAEVWQQCTLRKVLLLVNYEGLRQWWTQEREQESHKRRAADTYLDEEMYTPSAKRLASMNELDEFDDAEPMDEYDYLEDDDEFLEPMDVDDDGKGKAEEGGYDASAEF